MAGYGAAAVPPFVPVMMDDSYLTHPPGQDRGVYIVPMATSMDLADRYRADLPGLSVPVNSLEVFNGLVDRSVLGVQPGCLGVYYEERYPKFRGRADDNKPTPNHSVYHVVAREETRRVPYMFDFNDQRGYMADYEYYCEGAAAVMRPFQPASWRRFGFDGALSVRGVRRPLKDRAVALNSEEAGFRFGVCALAMVCAYLLVNSDDLSGWTVTGGWPCGLPCSVDRCEMVGYVLRQPSLSAMDLCCAAFGPAFQWLRCVDSAHLPPVAWQWLVKRAGLEATPIPDKRRRR